MERTSLMEGRSSMEPGGKNIERSWRRFTRFIRRHQQRCDTMIKITIPKATSGSRSTEPISMSHKIKWSIMILNSDGHVSEMLPTSANPWPPPFDRGGQKCNRSHLSVVIRWSGRDAWARRRFSATTTIISFTSAIKSRTCILTLPISSIFLGHQARGLLLQVALARLHPGECSIATRSRWFRPQNTVGIGNVRVIEASFYRLVRYGYCCLKRLSKLT
jgi:hypothetical protein